MEAGERAERLRDAILVFFAPKSKLRNFRFFAPKLRIFFRISTFRFLRKRCSFFEMFFANLFLLSTSSWSLVRRVLCV